MALTKQDLADIKEVVVDAVNESFETLSAPRFDALEVRMDRLEGRMDSLEGRMDSQEKELRTFKEEVYARFGAIDTKLQELTGKINMLDEDIRTLYSLLDAYRNAPPGEKGFAKLAFEKKLAILHAELHKTAKEAGITLPH